MDPCGTPLETRRNRKYSESVFTCCTLSKELENYYYLIGNPSVHKSFV